MEVGVWKEKCEVKCTVPEFMDCYDDNQNIMKTMSAESITLYVVVRLSLCDIYSF